MTRPVAIIFVGQIVGLAALAFNNISLRDRLDARTPIAAPPVIIPTSTIVPFNDMLRCADGSKMRFIGGELFLNNIDGFMPHTTYISCVPK